MARHHLWAPSYKFTYVEKVSVPRTAGPKPRVRGRDWNSKHCLERHCAVDFRSFTHQVAVVGPHCSRPACPRHFAQALRLSPLIGLEAFGKCLISPKFSSDNGNKFRAFDSRPVSCHKQPSVVSLLMETRYASCQQPLRPRSGSKEFRSA